MRSLAEQAKELADSLTKTLNDSICIGADLRVVEFPDDQFLLGHRSTADDPEARFIDVRGHESELFLRAHWRFGPNSSRRHIRTLWSQFGLYVWSVKDPHPLIRLEVDAEKDSDAWNVAHLQVHGVSQELGQVWGIRKIKNPRPLDRLHLPVGGFQYRPCLEDFIEFLVEEKLVRGEDGWRPAIEATRMEYRRKQLFSLIAKNPDAAREALAALEEE